MSLGKSDTLHYSLCFHCNLVLALVINIYYFLAFDDCFVIPYDELVADDDVAIAHLHWW